MHGHLRPYVQDQTAEKGFFHNLQNYGLKDDALVLR